MKTTVLGSGSWGTALAILLARNGHDVTLWGWDRDETESIQSLRENLRYMPGFAVPEGIHAEWDSAALGQCDMWVVAVPSGAARSVLPLVRGDDALVVIASKGLELGSAKPVSQVCEEVLPKAKCIALSGPNLAVEIVRGVPTAAVVASADMEVAEKVRGAFMCGSYRIYVSDDVVGVELAGSLKNVLAIGAGISDGLGFGDNTKGAFLARGLHEMCSIGMAMGGRMDTFMGIAGVGDLFATAVSKLSRNYRVGLALGQGRTLTDVLHEIDQVAEGVATSESAVVLARRHFLQVPVFEAIENILRGRLKPVDGVRALMERMPKSEGFLGN
jgi:glycerol-3-phosphate dehydrogenase (NAD(P)+)